MANRTPMKAIRAKCLDCCCDQAKEVRLCAALDCPLYEYRMGHRPKKEREARGFSEELEMDDGLPFEEEV